MGFLISPSAVEAATLLDFEESGNVASVAGGAVVTADGSFTLTNYATLCDPGTAEISFREPVSISSTTLSMDVSHLYRSMGVTVTLMNGTDELASASQSMINSTSDLYQSDDENIVHTLFFHFGSSLTEEEMKNITGVKIYCDNNYMSKDLVFDNLKEVIGTDNGSGLFADFEDGSNIRHYTNISCVANENAISGRHSAKYFTGAKSGNDNYMAICFRNPVSVPGKYVKFKVSGLAEDNLIEMTLFDGAFNTVAVASASHTYREDSDTYGSDRVKELYLEFPDLTQTESQSIGGIMIRHYSWTTNKITIDDIEFVSEKPSYSAFSATKFKQRVFYLSTLTPYGYKSEYTGNETDAIDHLAEANLNLIEFGVYDGKTDMIDYAGQKGLKVLASTSMRKSSESTIPLDYSALDWDLATYLELSKYQQKNVIGYLIYDEVNSNDFGTANKLKTYLNRYDPMKLAYSCLLPSYSMYDPNHDSFDYSLYESYVNGYIQAVNPQVLSFDYYPFILGWTDLIERDWYKDLGLFRKKAVENDIPFWYYVGTVDGNNNPLSPTKVNVQMNVALAYGAKYISLFGANGYLYDAVTFEKATDFNAKAINNKKVRNIGNLLFDKTATALYHTGMTSSVRNAYYADDLSDCNLFDSTSKLALSLTKKLIISIFEGTDGKQYVMFVNKDINNAISNLSLGLNGTRSVSAFDSLNGIVKAASSQDSITLNIEAGGSAVYVIG